ncbi:SCF ubiquitin ligase complex subunit [Ceratobasidium sp. UAMH 11750]|nr:SCF ubiquitin ligase complex subunit [Ceratobasidium sp. UAMH 11750]
MFISSNRPTASPAISATSVSDDEEDLENSAFYLDGDNKSRLLPAQFSNRLNSLTISESRNRTSALSLANAIPPEVLIHIFRLIPLLKDLYACLLVSRAWCSCAVELLWHKPVIAKMSSLYKLLKTLEQNHATFQYATFVRRLNLMSFGPDITDTVASRIAGCTRLERLTLVGCSALTDESLETILSGMPHLVALDLTGVSSVTDRSIKALARTASKLQGINLGGCKHVTDEGVGQLATHCVLLRRVKLAGLLVTNRSVIHLARSCPLLLEMDLNGCTAISNPAIRELWTCSRHIRELKLGLIGAALTDDAFPAPVDNQATRMIANSPASSEPQPFIPIETSLHTTRSFEHLRILDLTGCTSLTDTAVEGIISVAPKIRNLVLAKCALLTDNAIASVCKLGRYLHYLHLGHVSLITDGAVIQLARTCTRLRYVDLACCTQLTDLSVTELATLVKLRRIGLVRVVNLTDQAVFALSERQSSLERIHLSYCEQVTIPAVHFLLQRLHKLTHLSLTGIPAFRREELQRFCRTPPRHFVTTSNVAAHNALPATSVGQAGEEVYAPPPPYPGESSSPTLTVVGGSRRVMSANSSASASSTGIGTPDLVFAEGGASLHPSSTIRAHPHRHNTEPMSVSHPVYFTSTSPRHVIDPRQPEPVALPGDRALENSVREALTAGENGSMIVQEGGSDTDTPASVGAASSVGAGSSVGPSSTVSGPARGRLRMLRGVADYASALPWRRASRRQDGEDGGQ